MAKKLFGGKDNKQEELREARAVKSGKVSPAQYVKGEKSEGHTGSKKTAMAIKSGALPPAKYAGGAFKNGGMVKSKKGC